MSDLAPTITPTRPRLFVRIVMGPMTRVFNPIIGRLAGRKHLRMAALIYHTGRHSGRPYVTPASARLHGEALWIPLTFGTGSDWCRNVLAAGGCKIRWRGVLYEGTGPLVLDRTTSLRAANGAFKRHEKAMMRALGISQFLRLDLVGVATNDSTAGIR